MTSQLTHVLTQLALVLGAGAITALAFQALRLPVVLGYILAGLVIGPHVIRAVTDQGLVGTLSDLGVILLFFTIGLEFSIRTIARVGLPTLLTVIVELSAVTIVMYLAGHAFGWTDTEAMFVAIGVAIASTMLVVKGLEEHHVTGPAVELIFALMVVEDLLSILLLAVMTGIATGAGVSAGELGATLGKLGGFLVLIVVAGLVIVPRTIRLVARFERAELLLVTSLAVCFAMVWCALRAGYSIALGAFVAGMLIAESGKGHAVDALVRPFRDIFAAIFFIAIGMTIAPADVAAHWVAAVAVAVVLVVSKTIGVSVAAFFTGNGLRRSVQAGMTLSQIGEFAFIVVAVGVSAGVVRPFVLPIVVGASCVTAMSGSWQIRASGHAASWLDSHLPKPIATFVSFYGAWIANLRSGPSDDSLWRRLRRPLTLLVIDGVLAAATVIGAVAAHRTISTWLAARADIDERIAFGALVAVTVVIVGLFALGIARGAVRMAWLLATAMIPGTTPTGTAPRRALVVTLELAIALMIGLPIAAVIQPLVPGGGAIVLGILALLALATRRSIVDFEAHVRAGSALIAELLARQHSTAEAPHLEEARAVLPGFDGLVPVVIPEGAPATGKTLAELDLRAKTGASVLAIRSGGGDSANPSPRQPLCAGDVLALAGSDDAIVAARQLLLGVAP